MNEVLEEHRRKLLALSVKVCIGPNKSSDTCGLAFEKGISISGVKSKDI